MKKGQIYEGIIEKVDFPNKGRIFTEDRVVTVKNGIPGQKVEFLVTKLRKGKAEGRIQRVLEPSPEQKEAACRHFAACGGCIYQNLPYEKQLELKTGQVKRLLDEVCEDYNFEGIKESPQAFCFRNKMEFSFGDEVKDGPLALGLHKQGSFYDIVSVPDCQIVDEDFRKILSATLTFFQNSDNTFYHKMRHEGGLRHLLVRKGISTGEILAALVTTTQEEIDTDGYVRALHGLELEGTLVGILHIKNDSLADVVKNDEMKILYGQDYFYEKLLGLRFRISPFSFFQTNTLGAEVLYRTAREYIGQLGSRDEPDQVVFDLYSGTGTIAQILAPAAKKVIGVEIVEEAVEAARENAELNGLHNCEFLAGDVLKVLDEVEEKPDFIVLDPPRDGIHPKALKKIVEYGVGRILYISCKPTSLARDLVILQESGYRVERVCCVDMFPWSGNVETVVMLSHKKPDSVINVKVEFGEGEGKVPLDNIAKRAEAYKPKERVTYKMIKEYIEAKYGFKVHTAYIAEVKR
ncbi:MAG: 23S rRNA (uracil(1939)-C(5))-methyltransferase RlmD, partial [Lachnospiraceae bacterium]|nr:23S rRNA (uracil(1939)-C(5))-methyltransferase RlmD [Lachnospiraceae bacterium]